MLFTKTKRSHYSQQQATDVSSRLAVFPLLYKGDMIARLFEAPHSPDKERSCHLMNPPTDFTMPLPRDAFPVSLWYHHLLVLA